MSTPWNDRSSGPASGHPSDAPTAAGSTPGSTGTGASDHGDEPTAAGTGSSDTSSSADETVHAGHDGASAPSNPFATGGFAAPGGQAPSSYQAPTSEHPAWTPSEGPATAPEQPYAPPSGGHYGTASVPSYPPPAGTSYPMAGSPYPQPGSPYPQPGAPYPQPGSPYPQLGGWQMSPPTSGLAVASLVCGIVGFFVAGITSIPAVICGHLAWPETKNGQASGHGMAIAGLILGYIQFLCWIAFWIVVAVARS